MIALKVLGALSVAILITVAWDALYGRRVFVRDEELDTFWRRWDGVRAGS